MKRQKLFFGFSFLLATVSLLTAAEAPLYIRTLEKEPCPRQVLKAAVPDGKVSITVTAPADGATVPVLFPQQKAFLAMPRAERIKFFANQKNRILLRRTGFYPAPVKLQWKCTAAEPHVHRVVISESPDFRDSVQFTVKSCELAVDNLKIAQKYYWQVSDPNGGMSKKARFTTEDIAPRLIRIDGVPNVRDFGGRIGLGGRRVKQGLIYRSAGLNGNASNEKLKPEEALKLKPDLRPSCQPVLDRLQACKKLLADKTPVTYLKPTVGREWQVFICERHVARKHIRNRVLTTWTIPEKIHGFERRTVTADATGSIRFAPKNNAGAFFMQEFESPEDGFMQLGIGADWYCFAAVNGICVFDTLLTGNVSTEVNAENHFIEIPVKKGKNLFVVAVRSGSEGWQWSCRPPENELPRAKVLEGMIKLFQASIDYQMPYSPNRKAGQVRLNDAMKKYLIEDLGWKSDIDLRTDRECFRMTGSPAGEAVKWFHISSSAYAGMQTPSGKAAFAKVFRVFLDPANYPIDFHCIAGQDRTGAVAFILNALLGVEEEELYRDWESTGFWNSSLGFTHKKLFNKLVAGFRKNPGKTIHEQVENYVLSLGFKPEEIRQFREFMLEK